MRSTIVESPHILFLGAGASKPYEKLLMGEFVRSFRANDRRWSAPPVTARGIRPPQELLDAICKEHEDLEFLMEELDAVSSRIYLEGRDHPFGRIALPDNASPARGDWPEFRILASEARDLLSALKREVYLHYRDIPNPSRTNVLKRVVRTLKTASHPTIVFTTNYDPAVERFCANEHLRLTDGFKHNPERQEYVWNRSVFDGFQEDPEKSLVLFKLHGSASWHRQGDRIIKGPPMYYAADPDYDNVMIYPATRKVAISDPFFTAYDYLARCLDAAEFCLVVGYSFRDYDTLMRFKSAVLSNPGLRIGVLDPNAKVVCQYLDQQGITAQPLPFAFGEDKELEYQPLIAAAVDRK